MRAAVDKLILVGRVAGAFGVKGEIRLTPFTESPGNLLDYGVLLDDAGAPFLTLTGGRVANEAVLARAKEVATREEAQALRGRRLYISRESLPPPEEEDEFYLADLIGARVVSEDGESVGTVKFVADFGAGDLIEIEPASGGASFYVPFTKDDVPDIDLESGVVVVKTSSIPEQASPEGAPEKT